MADPSVTLRVDGLSGLVKAADAAGKATKKMVRDRLREVAQPVLHDARTKLSRYDARSASRLGVSIRRVGTVTVEQRLRRTTGAHPQFGSLQMQEALMPALDENADNVERSFEDALDDIADIFTWRT
jgi:hypothetical protein